MSIVVLTVLTLQLKSQEKLSPPGELVDVNGYKIHLITTGDEGPAVVFFHGAGDIGLIWNLVLPGVSKFAKGVAVDHAGEGWSEHGHAVHMWQQAYDTYTALQNAGIKGPYILVGHSLGGILTRVFANAYPEEVAGVVLVDATHPDVVLKYYNNGNSEWQRSRLRSKGREIPPVNTSRLTSPPELTTFKASRDFGDKFKDFSEEDQRRFQWFYNERPFSYVKGRSSYESETMAILYENEDEYGFGNVPLIVLSKGIRPEKEGDDRWSSEQLRAHSIHLQEQLLNLSSDSKQIIAKKSGHQIHLDQPKLVVQAIQEIAAKIEKKK